MYAKGQKRNLTPEQREQLAQHARDNMNDPEIREKMYGPEAQEKKRRTVAKKRAFRNLAKYMLETELTGDTEDVRENLEACGFDQFDYQSGILLSQIMKALHGDTDAARFVRDSSGQKPTETLQVGNMDDVPVTEMDLSQLSTAELKEMIAEIEASDE
jgi:hypothetical protein